MGYAARWGPKGFIISANKIVAMEELATSLTLKQDSENDTSGTETTNTRGRELRPITFKVSYLAAAGVDPRGQIKEWEAQLGNAYPLIIGGEQFGEEKMKLTKVDSKITLHPNTGKFLRADISITLEEYSDGKTSQLVSNNTTTKTAPKAGPNAEKAAALGATPPASVRAEKAFATRT